MNFFTGGGEGKTTSVVLAALVVIVVLLLVFGMGSGDDNDGPIRKMWRGRCGSGPPCRQGEQCVRGSCRCGRNGPCPRGSVCKNGQCVVSGHYGR